MTAAIAPRMFVTPFTVAAGGVASSPIVLDNVRVAHLRVIIPDGHNGLTALQIQSGGNAVFPLGVDPFIRGNNEIIDFDWDAEVTANGLTMQGFNSDIFPHTWTLRWTLTDLGGGSPVVIESPQAGPAGPATASATITQLTGIVDQAAIDQLTASVAAAAQLPALTGPAL